MNDTLQPMNGEPLTHTGLTTKTQATGSVANSENLIQNHKRLSLLAQIYNWQPTGVVVKFHLPIVNVDNYPLFALRVAPNWIPLSNFYKLEAGSKADRIHRYNQQKGWVIPCDLPFGKWDADEDHRPPMLELKPIGKGITVVEYDDPPDIAFWNLNCIGWRGSINYQIRVISNVTTQGKIAISRMYDVNVPPYLYDPSLYRTPMPIIGSQSFRRKNAQMLLDLSRADDFEINAPYISKQSYQPNLPTFSPITCPSGPMNSYILFDVIDTLSVSAGAAEFSFEIWIQAGPDFEYVFPMAPTTTHYQTGKYRASGNGDAFIAFGQDTNVSITMPDTLAYKTSETSKQP